MRERLSVGGNGRSFDAYLDESTVLQRITATGPRAFRAELDAPWNDPDHKDLIVWQNSIALASKVYAATRQLPSDEPLRARPAAAPRAVSVPSNIAEGAAQGRRGEFMQFLHIARGSLSELETQTGDRCWPGT